MSPRPLSDTNAEAMVYGAVVATAIAAGLSLDRQLSPGAGALALVGSSTALWVAHVYAVAVQRRHGASRWLSLREVLRIAYDESPQLAACVPSAAMLLAGAIGLMGHDAAFNAATWIGIATLFGLGTWFGTQAGQGPRGALLSGFVDAALGALVVAIKILLSHQQ